MKLIKETSKQRYYQLDFKIYQFKRPSGKLMTIEELFSTAPKLRPEYTHIEELKYVDKVCVSDANTHIERLVFPAFNVLNTQTNEIIPTHDLAHIAGCWTMRIHGGNSNAVWPDAVYVRYLRMLNKEFNK